MTSTSWRSTDLKLPRPPDDNKLTLTSWDPLTLISRDHRRQAGRWPVPAYWHCPPDGRHWPISRVSLQCYPPPRRLEPTWRWRVRWRSAPRPPPASLRAGPPAWRRCPAPDCGRPWSWHRYWRLERTAHMVHVNPWRSWCGKNITAQTVNKVTCTYGNSSTCSSEIKGITQ